MKKTLIVLIVVLLILSFAGCKSQEQKMIEQAMQEFEDMTGQEQYGDSDSMQDWEDDMEPNDDGFDDDYQNEQAGVDDGDGNYDREGETYVEDGENSVQLGGGEWPEDAPDVIEEPEFGEAEISGIISSGSGTVITYLNVAREEAATLIGSYLDNNDWKMLAHTNDSDWEVYSGQNGNIVVTIEWDGGDFSILWETF